MKDGLVNNTMGSDTHTASELEELRREVRYLRKLAEKSTARMLTVETQAISIRHELEQKRRGFSLMADLAVNVRHGADYNAIFTSVARRINATLNMQRTVVLRPEPDGCFRPSIIQGYDLEEMKDIAARRLALDAELLRPDQALLLTGADPAQRQAEFRQALELPFLIAVPVYVNGRTVAVLATGRTAEQPPFLPRLGQSDMETVETLSTYLAFMLTGQLLEEEEAEKYNLEEIMRTVFTASMEGYIVWNGDMVERVSPGALKLLGRPAGSVLVDHNAVGLSTEHLNTVFKKVLNNGRTREELLLRHQSGELIPCEISHLPLRLQHSTCLLSYIRDLREQKAHEKELLAAKEQAEAAAVTKSEFLANISHEIRTPMNAIVGLTHILKDSGNLGARQSEYVYSIDEAASNLLRIITDVLDFSKMDTGALVMESIPFKVENALDAVMKLNRPLAESKGLLFSLHNNLPMDSPQAQGDLPRLKQLLNNLIGNALKFTEEGEVSVSVEALPSPETGGRLGFKFAIKDTGIGISPEKMGRIFEAFSQADGSSTRKYGGAGLGLAISRQLATMFGGAIWAESLPRRGSAFFFTAFFDRAAAREATPPAPRAVKTGELTIQGHILLVEDNAVNQLVAKKIMEKVGLSVTVADNGKAALTMIETQHFDLVLMDIQMPEMDGLTATRHIRANPKFAKLPIIAMTAHALDDDRNLSLSTGMNAHITKPINLKELFEVLGRWMPGAEGSRPLRL